MQRVPTASRIPVVVPTGSRPRVIVEEAGRSQFPDNTPMKFLKRHLHLVLLVVCIALGFIFGLSLRPLHPTQQTIKYILFPGELLLRMLGLIVQPLMITGIIVGLSACQIENALKLTLRTLVYFLITSFLASAMGCVLMVAINPGSHASRMLRSSRNFTLPESSSADLVLDFFRNLFPVTFSSVFAGREGGLDDAAVQSWAAKMDAVLTAENISAPHKCCTLDHFASDHIQEVVYFHDSNFIGLIVFFTAFGLCLPHFNELGLILAKLASIVFNTLTRMLQPVMWYAPLGIFFLIFGGILNTSQLGIPVNFAASGFYLLTILTAYVAHDFIVLPGLFLLFTKQNPYPYIARTLAGILTAFGTASGAATLPFLIKLAETKLEIDTRISRYFLPLATILNLDGTAMYQATAAIFVAQTYGLSLGVQELFSICCTATVTSLCMKVVPHARLTSLAIVLNAGKIPHENVLILGCLEWILGRFRTTMNITSDLFGLGIMQCLSTKNLEHDRYVDLHADIDAVSQTSGYDLLAAQQGLDEQSNFRKQSFEDSLDLQLGVDPVLKYLLEKRPAKNARTRTASC
ncbi:Excitatory amino acid transporter 3 [Hypsibius exemplaris]|uniref:Amino acid transporter n=1 Tax=Hypsibius exemplaris TaxID=2072580 RepID=A0A1W0WGE1_HYPEX|nr:Excitatory amino acid transporter 3 [Hypsibius exemplaris]